MILDWLFNDECRDSSRQPLFEHLIMNDVTFNGDSGSRLYSTDAGADDQTVLVA